MIFFYDLPHHVLMPLDPILNGAAHHHFLLSSQTIRIRPVHTIHAIEGLQRRWCPKLCTPIGFGAIDTADVQICVFLFWNWFESIYKLLLYLYNNDLMCSFFFG